MALVCFRDVGSAVSGLLESCGLRSRITLRNNEDWIRFSEGYAHRILDSLQADAADKSRHRCQPKRS